MEEISQRISRFKIDLADKSCTDDGIVSKHISFGTPFIFSHNEQAYHELKHQIASHFEIHQSEVVMVGSAKLGFSIAPTKQWKPFDDESDIDMVIISEKVFDKFWMELYNFNISLTARLMKEDLLYRKFLDYFFKGWLRPDLFPFEFSGKNEWFDFFRDIAYKDYGNRKITGAVFRNQFFFTNYHVQNIKSLRVEV